MSENWSSAQRAGRATALLHIQQRGPSCARARSLSLPRAIVEPITCTRDRRLMLCLGSSFCTVAQGAMRVPMGRPRKRIGKFVQK